MAQKQRKVWMIGRIYGGESYYWDGTGTIDTSFVPDINKGIQFVRRKDALIVCESIFMSGMEDIVRREVP